jgi:hypothetical protein
MLRTLKTYGCVAMLAVAIQGASAFTLLGPREPYQTLQLGYIGDFSEQPHNIGEEYRWNVPVLYYTYDQPFLDYFGSNGVYAIDSAVNMLNSLFSTNVSSWSSSLSEFPIKGTEINPTASALHLFDLKSCALEIMLEHLGLGDPELFVWTLRGRTPTPSCPSFIYQVIMRSFDPITYEPSFYVNGRLFTYAIFEFCPAPDQAICFPILVDQEQEYAAPIASLRIAFNSSLWYGAYHTALTYDDVGGLRYLFRTNNVNPEGAGPGTVTFITNTTTPTLIYSSNLTEFAQQAISNTAPALQAIYPNLVISSTTGGYTNVWVTNITTYYTNYPLDPVGVFPALIFVTNRTLTAIPRYQHTFENLVGIRYDNTARSWVTYPITDLSTFTNRTVLTLQNITVGLSTSPYMPAGFYFVNTNITSRNFVTNTYAGEYYILPTNNCGIQILTPQLTFTNGYTNVIAWATNAAPTNTVGLTNIVGNTNFPQLTNFSGSTFTQQVVQVFTNHAFVVYPVACVPTNIANRQGLDTIKYVRRDYDSLLGRFWAPITNSYWANSVSNNIIMPQYIQRVVTTPDYVFSAGDLVGPPANFTVARSVPVWNTNAIFSPAGIGVYGPGTIEPVPATSFTFNKVGPLNYNFTPSFMDEATATIDFTWASYDGSTNAPIIYPTGASVFNLESQVLLQMNPATFPDGQVDVEYALSLSGSGGEPPYSFSLAPNSAGLPPGFDPPQADGTFAGGVIRGDPTAPGTYDFVLRMTDSGGRFLDRAYTLVIFP